MMNSTENRVNVLQTQVSDNGSWAGNHRDVSFVHLDLFPA